MREIKFRAFWKDTGDKVEDFCTEYLIDACNESCFIVNQCTGLKDKNGVDIYEGDIIRNYISNHEKNVSDYDMHPKRWDFVILIENGCVGTKGSISDLHHEDDLKFNCIFDSEDGEFKSFDDALIIGNIYENPELLSE